MTSPDTSAQDAPVASQEAEESVRKTRARYEAEANSFIGYHSSGSIMDDRMASKRARLSAIGDELEAVIRASERERYAPFIEAAKRVAREVSYGREGVSGLHSVKVAHVDVKSLQAFYTALAALEEAGSA